MPGLGFLVIAMAVCLVPVTAARGGDYGSVSGPCRLTFPRDHGAHPDFRTEWWYWTGNVASPQGRRFGFQLTFFRSRIRPPAPIDPGVDPPSAWRTDQLYLAHAAVADLDERRHLQAERTARGALCMAGVESDGPRTRVHLNRWFAELGEDRHTLSADAGDFAVDLSLTPVKPPVLHGDAGYSSKGTDPRRASCYYSFTRLAAAGHLRIGTTDYPVSGLAWMDQEFSSAPLEPGITGWDWFSLQFSDGTEMMVYLLRESGGALHPASAGTFVDRDGAALALALSDIRIETVSTWKSPVSGAVYPSGWRLAVPRLDLEATVASNLGDQEMRTPDSTGVTYWEGSVSMEGRRKGAPVTGSGYVEMTGYDRPFGGGM